MAEANASVPPSSEVTAGKSQKAFFDMFRWTASGASTPASEAVTPDGKAPSAEEATPATQSTTVSTSGLTAEEINARWEKTIAEARAKTSMMTKLKRLASKDGKAAKVSKGKEKEIVGPVGEPTVEHLAAIIPLPEDAPRAASPATSKSTSSNPGSNTLSRKIQYLLSNVPPFLHTVPGAQDKPPPPVTINDSSFLGYLTSASVMNGSGDTKQRSVWQVLDRLVPYKPQPDPPSAKTASLGLDNGEDPEEEAAETSLMLYGDLVPTEDTKIEVAESEIIEVSDAEDVSLLKKTVAKGVFASLMPQVRNPFKKKAKASASASSTPGPASSASTPAATPPPVQTPPSVFAASTAKTIKVWIPSPTKVSLQVAWWGFRIWLPHPVLQVLNSKEIEVAQKASMITAAIGSIIKGIPTAALPPQLKTAVTLLQAIVPILGYVGGFISWAWGEILSYDKGSGVVLSATWILPIALIPSSWEVQTSKVQFSMGTTRIIPAHEVPRS